MNGSLHDRTNHFSSCQFFPQTVIAQWYEGSKEIVEAIERNYALADDMARTLSAPGDSGPVEGESNDKLSPTGCVKLP